MGPVLAAALVLLLGAAFAPACAQVKPPCPIPPELRPDPVTLPNTKAHLKAQDEIRIVALGGGATQGRSVPSGQAYPDRLAAWLQQGMPQARWSVSNHGRVGDSADAMVKRLRRDVLPNKPSLVLWETGTHEAAIGGNVETFSEAVQSGIEMLRAAKIDLILVDMQYSPRTTSVINFEPYLNALHDVAEQNEVPIYERYQLMRAWTDAGLFDFHTRDAAKRAEGTRRIYDCIGAGLAEMIIADLK
jgi:acyl-CoA thioesterase-1